MVLVRGGRILWMEINTDMAPELKKRFDIIKLKFEVQKIVDSFCDDCIIPENIRINIVDNIFESSLAMPTTHKIRERISKNKVDINGTIVLGKTVGDIINVMISSKVFMYANNTWVGTIYHELSHACDYFEYAKEMKIIYFNDIFNKYFNAFVMWSEFYARKKGFKKVRELSYKFSTQESEMEHIKDEELILIIKWYKEVYKGYQEISDIYNLMQALGRIALFAELFPEMNSSIVEKTFANTIEEDKLWIVRNIFDFCKSKSDISNFVKHRRKLYKLLRKLK